ncbi:N-acetyltransferase [Verticiella sediminum]|uniref:N-acetyltransferase n=2 Tax=Verticiella sediminum TaxID=1247510 RepID=A0A556ABB3_9BURK|nr:GNAT family N-acetyltransferase [Verticiella sediminum]TSH90163.1 N-acetyltransferase [Verticiella sediminum]
MSTVRSVSSPTVRDAREDDMARVLEIYTPYVLHGRATFEEQPPTLQDMLARRAAVLAAGLPYLVAELDGAILGYAYAGSYRARPAYRYTIEDSVYVADGSGGLGVGSALLAALVARCEAGPWRQMVAVIGGSDNLGSVALHRRMGFEPIGTMPAVGYKLGDWVDTVIMQRPLGPGRSTAP